MIQTSFFSQVSNTYFPEPSASLLNGILFGLPLDKHSLFYSEIQRVGLLHLVVLSGMNITILALIVGKLTSSFGKQVSLLLTILTVILFILFVGPKAPIIRAGITGVLTFVSLLYGKRSNALYLLFISALCIALIWPKWLTQISFYLSYGATLGIILFSSKIREGNYLLSELWTSLSAQIFTAPLIFIYFKQVSLISPLANILVAWAITPIMILGFTTAILGKINIALGTVPAYLTYSMLSYVVFIIHILSKIPFTYFDFN